MTATQAGCVRSSQAGTKLDRTQTAVGLLRFGMQDYIKLIAELKRTAYKSMQTCMTTLLELVTFLAPPLRPDANLPCALRLAGAVSTVEPM